MGRGFGPTEATVLATSRVVAPANSGGEESLRRWRLLALPLPAEYTGAVVFEESQGQ